MIKRLFKKRKDSTAMKKLKSEETLLVTFSELQGIPFDYCDDIYPERPNAVTCTRVRGKNPDRISFRVTMNAGELWHNHYHDCEENLIVFEGCIYDSINDKKASRMGTMKIEPYGQHIIKALEDSIFYVEFKKRTINGNINMAGN